MEKIENEKLLEEIWNDADFKTSKSEPNKVLPFLPAPIKL